MPTPRVGASRLLRSWSAVAGLAAGVLWGFGHRALVPGLVLVALASVMLSLRRSAAALLVGVVLTSFGAGAIDASLRGARDAAVTTLARDFAHCEVAGRVLEGQGALGTLVVVEQARCPGFQALADAGNVMFPASRSSPGAEIWSTGTFTPLQDDAFDLARRRAGAAALFDPEGIRTRPPEFLPLRLAASIRRGLLHATGRLGSPERGLLRGLTIGDTTSLDQITIDDFRRAGLSHLLAVSGENLAMFLGALALVIRRLSYRLRLGAYLAAIALFVLVVGPQPSVLRAAVMGAVMVAAVGRGHRAEPLAVLATALIAVIAFRPDLVYSVALQLSAAATAGIVLWTKPLERLLRPLPRFASLPLAVTISAQAAVAPILIATFGQLSVVSPLANLLAFPAVAPPTVLGLCAGGVSLLDPAAGQLLSKLASPFVAWIAWVAAFFAHLPAAAVDLPRGAALLAAAPLTAAALAAASRASE